MNTFAHQALRLLMCVLFCFPIISRADVFVRDDIILDPTPGHFSVCHGHTCELVSEVSLKPAEWADIRASFNKQTASPATEREQIRVAIAKMERFVGAAIGTSADRGRNESNDAGLHAKMDCIDESTNTTLYLTLFKHQGLLHHHQIEDRSTRGWFLFGMPHTTAVIRDIVDSSLWAVDSWFLDNGKPPFIVSLEKWREGWKPENLSEVREQ